MPPEPQPLPHHVTRALDNLELDTAYDDMNVLGYARPPASSPGVPLVNIPIAGDITVEKFLQKYNYVRGKYNDYDRLSVGVWNALVIMVSLYSDLSFISFLFLCFVLVQYER